MGDTYSWASASMAQGSVYEKPRATRSSWEGSNALTRLVGLRTTVDVPRKHSLYHLGRHAGRVDAHTAWDVDGTVAALNDMVGTMRILGGLHLQRELDVLLAIGCKLFAQRGGRGVLLLLFRTGD